MALFDTTDSATNEVSQSDLQTGTAGDYAPNQLIVKVK